MGNQCFSALLRNTADVFSAKGEPNGLCNLPAMSIKTTRPPISQATYRTPLHKRKLDDDAIDEMLAAKVISLSNSP